MHFAALWAEQLLVPEDATQAHRVASEHTFQPEAATLGGAALVAEQSLVPEDATLRRCTRSLRSTHYIEECCPTSVLSAVRGVVGTRSRRSTPSN